MKVKIGVDIIVPLAISIVSPTVSLIFSNMEALRIIGIIIGLSATAWLCSILIWRKYVRDFVDKRIAESRAELERELRAEIQAVSQKSANDLIEVTTGQTELFKGINEVMHRIIDLLKDR